MSTGLLQQLDAYFSDIDANQPVVTPERVSEHVDRVTYLPVPQPKPVRGRPRVWVAIAAAAAVAIVVGTIPLLASRSERDIPPATEPSTAPTSVVSETPTTTVGAGVDGSASPWTLTVQSLDAAPPYPWGTHNGEFVMLRQGVEGGGQDGLTLVERNEGGRAYLYRSADGIDWTKTHVERLDGLILEPTVVGDVFFTLAYVPVAEQADWAPEMLRSEDGVNWEPFVLNNPNGGAAAISVFGPAWQDGRSATAKGDQILTVGTLDGSPCLWLSSDRGATFDCVAPPIEVGVDVGVPGATPNSLRLGTTGVAGNQFVVFVGADSTTGPVMIVTHVLTSADGNTWQTIELDEPISLAAATYHDGAIALLTEQTGGGQMDILRLSVTGDGRIEIDSVSSIPRTLRAGPAIISGGIGLTAVFNIDADFIADDTIWISEDGTQWTAVPAPAAAGNAIAVGGLPFVSAYRGVNAEGFGTWVLAR